MNVGCWFRQQINQAGWILTNAQTTILIYVTMIHTDVKMLSLFGRFDNANVINPF